MAHPISQFFRSKPDTPEYNAVLKAVKDRPRVTYIGENEGRKYFEVRSTNKLGSNHVVRLWEEKDRQTLPAYDVVEVKGQLVLRAEGLLQYERGEFWVECFCEGATPPLQFNPAGVLLLLCPAGMAVELFEPVDGLIAWVPKVCYHQAAVIIEATQQNWL